MTRTNALAIVVFVLAAGCGGGSSTHQNAAAAKSFTYGAPTTATAAQSGVLQTQLDTAIAAQNNPGGTSAMGLADFQSVTTTLLGDSGAALAVAGASPVMQRALAGRAAIAGGTVTGFDDPTCQTVTASSVTLKGCTTTIVYGTTTERVSVSGSLALSNANQTLTWDLSIAVAVTDTSMGIGETVNVHQSGTLTVTASTIQGSMLSETTANVTYGGMTFTFGFDESVNVDVTYAGSPPCVTSGTLEAKRVWTQRPVGAPASAYPDLGAKVTWTGCNVATIALSN
jgi:hypothetical protein